MFWTLKHPKITCSKKLHLLQFWDFFSRNIMIFTSIRWVSWSLKTPFSAWTPLHRRGSVLYPTEGAYSITLSLFQYSAPSHGGLTHSSHVSRVSGRINGVVKNDGEASLRCSGNSWRRQQSKRLLGQQVAHSSPSSYEGRSLNMQHSCIAAAQCEKYGL